MAGIDYSKIPTEDLLALKEGNLGKVSTSTLQALSKGGSSTLPARGDYKDSEVLPWLVHNIVRPSLEFGGMAVGGLVGAGAGAPTGPGAAVTALAGGTLGYGMGRQAANLLEEGVGMRKPQDVLPRMAGAGRDLIEGAEMEMGGRFLGKGIEYIGAGAKQALGALTGTGNAAIEQAIGGTPAFKDAMRGRISGEAIVGHARDALGVMKLNRGSQYQKELSNLTLNTQQIDLTPIKSGMKTKLGEFVRIDATGKPDWTRSSLGPENSEGVNKIREIVSLVEDFGSKPGDNTAVGLDMFKRQLDDFYSESSSARAFVSGLRDTVKNTLVKSVPEYEKMTKGYAEATNLIKDIESNLMLRKEGMSGRIVADQTLRRLTSAMKDNFELRRDLVAALGNKAAIDLTGEVAGHAMSSYIPRGLSGSGLALGQMSMAYLVSPKIWPILAASSPRVAGEFLNVFGQALQAANSPLRETVKRLMIFNAMPKHQEESVPAKP